MTSQVEIEDREIIYKSYKSYAAALKIEVRSLQQLLPTEDIQRAYNAVKRAVREGKVRGRIWAEKEVK